MVEELEPRTQPESYLLIVREILKALLGI